MQQAKMQVSSSGFHIRYITYDAITVQKASFKDFILLSCSLCFKGEMIDKMTLLFNRTRQAVITKELIEIISGAAAI